MKSRRTLFAALLLATASACNEADDANANSANRLAEAGSDVTAAAQSGALALSKDRSLLTLTGKVVATTPNSFQLDYGTGAVTVEMDDWDFYKEGRGLRAGDEVIVTGRVDQDLLQRRTIEASTVFVRNLGTYFYASGADEEVSTTLVYVPPSDGLSDITGAVSAVEGRELTVGGSSEPIRIDTANLRTAPQVKVGDRIYTWGTIDIDPQERTELMARGLVILSPDRTKEAARPQPG